MNKPTRRVAVYLRVSGTEQAERGSIETQRDFLRDYAARAGLEIVEEYRDEPVPGSSPVGERPDGGRLLRDVERGRFEAVLVYKLDRLARSVYQLLCALRIFDAANIAFLSATEAFDTSTNYGRMTMGLMAVFAQWERDLIGERSQEGRRRVTREGRWAGGPPPLGYRLESGTLILDDAALPGLTYSEADLVRRIFRSVGEEGLTPCAVVKQFHEEVVPTGQECNYPRRKMGKLAAGWRDTTLRQILRNPIYCGRLVYGKRARGTVPAEGEAPAVVSVSLWEAAQAQLKRNSKHSPRNTRPDRCYLLSGLVLCPDCGHRMTGITTGGKGQRRYYACPGRRNPEQVWGNTGRRCTTAYLPADELEAAIWSDVVEFAQSPQLALDRLAADLEARGNRREELQSAVDDLAGLLKGIEDHRRRALSLFVRGQIDEGEKDGLLAEISADHERLAAQHAERAADLNACLQSEAQMGLAERLLNQFGKRVLGKEHTPWEKQRLLRDAVLRVEPRPDGNVVVRYVFSAVETSACRRQIPKWHGFEVVYAEKEVRPSRVLTALAA